MLLGTKDAAIKLCLHRSVVTELAKTGYLKGIMIGNSWAFEKEEVDSFARRNKG